MAQLFSGWSALELMIDGGGAHEVRFRFRTVAGEFLAQPERHKDRRVDGVELRGAAQIVVDGGRLVVVVAAEDRRARQEIGIGRGDPERLLITLQGAGARRPVGLGSADRAPCGEPTGADQSQT
jgi:hypothetical protein